MGRACHTPQFELPTGLERTPGGASGAAQVVAQAGLCMEGAAQPQQRDSSSAVPQGAGGHNPGSGTPLGTGRGQEDTG